MGKFGQNSRHSNLSLEIWNIEIRVNSNEFIQAYKVHIYKVYVSIMQKHSYYFLFAQTFYALQFIFKVFNLDGKPWMKPR